MAAHNAAEHLTEAIDSILGQSFRDFEFLIVDDASSDATPDMLARAARSDPRIRLLRLDENHRLAGALNRGLEIAEGRYIARMDADDVSAPGRLARQVGYLEAHPETILVGCSVDYIDAAGRHLRRSRRPRDGAAVRWLVRFQPAIPHPSFLFRRATPDGTALRYDAALAVAQDYDFVVRALDHGEAVCLPDRLLKYRQHAKAVSRTRYLEQGRVARQVGTAYQRRTLPEEVFEALADMRACFFDLAEAGPERCGRVLAGAQAMLAHDLATMPGRATWLRRQTAQLAFWALRRGGAGRAATLGAFARHGRGLMGPAAMRALETSGLLPAALCAEPEI